MDHNSNPNYDLASTEEVRQRPQAPFMAGDWLVEPELNSLRHGNVERHLEPKVMKVLLALAERPNHVVSKEDLMAAVWPGTFVSDDVLTRCISILRRSTRDASGSPFIQTIPKAGYRLVADVHPVAPVPPATDPEPEPVLQVQPVADARQLKLPPAAVETGTLRTLPWTWLLAGASLLVLTLAILVTLKRSSRPQDVVLRTLPFTTQAGEQLQPAFSPDGATLAYVAVAPDGSSQHLYLQRVGSEATQQVTSGPGQGFSPAWSPDGRRIAFLSSAPDGLGLFLLDLATHSTRRIYVPQQVTHWDQTALSWSPDGRSLVFPDHSGSSPNSSIYLLDLETLQTHDLTHPPDGWEGDLTPAFSPDGKRIAFTRASETAVRDLFWVNTTGGAVHPITHDGTNIDSLAWSVSGQSIVFSSNRGGKPALWRVALKGGEPERMPLGTEDAAQPSIRQVGDVTRYAYTQGSAVWSIIDVTGNSSAQPRTVVSSTQQDSAPSLSADGRRFAFQSQRSGSQEIWVANIDGSDPHQITHQNGPLTGSPSWAHTRDQIAFDSRVGGHSHIFIITPGGKAQQLTSGDFNDITPRWSNDDKTLFFRSNRGDRWQLWRMDLSDRRPQPLTVDDGIVPQQSPDGAWVYYARGGEPGLWRVPLNGGTETKILPQPGSGYWGFWQVTSRGIVYLDTDEKSIRIYDPATNQTSTIARLAHLPPRFAGLTVSPDGLHVLLTDEAQAGRHITLAEMGKP